MKAALYLLASSLLITACGSDSEPPSPAPAPPPVTATAPVIVTQPQAVTATAGTTAIFSVVASGQGTLSYQWQKNGADIAGATATSYTTPALSQADNNATFRARVSNAAGSVDSVNAVLTVTAAAAAPTITTQPSNVTVAVGATATFSVMASGTAPLTYQWQRNGADITGATQATYVTPATVAGDGGSIFRVIVTGAGGTVTSSAAVLTITVQTAPSITIQPTNQTASVGSMATFSVTATGTGPLTYVWSRNGAPINGATSASYSTPALTAADDGATFRVRVANALGNVTSSDALLRVIARAGTAGCGRTPSATGSMSASLQVAGKTRMFSYEVPAGYQPQEPIPVVFGFHGAGGNGAFIYSWGMHTAAAQAGQRAIFIYPDGVFQGNTTGWAMSAGGEDVAFFDSMLTWAGDNFCIDNNRVFVTGFSWGTDFANALGCFRGDKIRAIYGYSGSLYSSNCTAVTPAFRLTYSTPDGSDAYSQADFDRAVNRYKSAHQCSTQTRAISPSPCVEYQGCGKPVQYCAIPGLGHNVPATSGVDTWSFFATFN